MKAKFSLLVFSIILMFIPVLFISLSQADIKDDIAKVKICGKVTGGYNKDGLLYIALSKVVNNIEAPELEFAVVSKIDSSGEYCIEAPMGIGNVNLTVFNPPDAASELIKYKVPFATYLGNPLHINDKDISGVDIVFKPHGKTPVLMEDYDGQTVSISGKVFMDDYKDGHIGITANADEPGPPGINIVIIEKPGQYSFSIPKNFGEVYIAAFNIREDKSQSYSEVYPKNPILVKDKNIKKIDITIGQKELVH